MKYKQLSLFEFGRKPNLTLTRCWRCQEYFPLSKIRFFDCIYPSGYVGTYQACPDCYKAIMDNRGLL